MKELKNIISAIEYLEKTSETAIATLVKVSGSTYRSPSARMLISNIIWGLGLGCQGIAYVLIESLQQNKLQEIAFIKKCLSTRTYGAIAKVITVEGKTQTQVGQHLLLGEDTIINNLSDDNLLTEVLKDTKAA